MYVLFIDDSCGARAPLAEALLRHIAPWHEGIGVGWTTSHVRPEVRDVLAEIRVNADGIRARGLSSVALDEVEVVVRFVPDEGRLRVPGSARTLSWMLPDPLSAPPGERLEAFRAARDEIERRLRKLAEELG